MKDLSYKLYMAEQEGYLDTREGKIQRIIDVVKDYPENEIPDLVFYTICEDCGISSGSLTNAEMEHIERALKK